MSLVSLRVTYIGMVVNGQTILIIFVKKRLKILDCKKYILSRYMYNLNKIYLTDKRLPFSAYAFKVFHDYCNWDCEKQHEIARIITGLPKCTVLCLETGRKTLKSRRNHVGLFCYFISHKISESVHLHLCFQMI